MGYREYTTKEEEDKSTFRCRNLAELANMAVPFKLDELTLFLDQASARLHARRHLRSRRDLAILALSRLYLGQVSLISDLDAMDAHGALNEEGPGGDAPAERVKLMTVHASKARCARDAPEIASSATEMRAARPRSPAS